MLYAVILAGGRGTRFWPLSRTSRPKQLLRILSERSLLEKCVDRIAPLVQPERVYVLGNAILRRAIQEQLPQVPVAQIIAEPVSHNTAPCIGLAAHLIARHDPDAVLAVLPSDQTIARSSAFLDCLRAAESVAEKNGNIVVMGLTPTRPETGYGYVRIEGPEVLRVFDSKVFAVRSFVEKPDRATAERYLAAGDYYWNGGIFVWSVRTIIDTIEKFLPKTHHALQKIAAHADSHDFETVLEEWYARTDSISVDYGVMEKASNIFCVAADIGWNDVGSWEALYEISKKDGQGNVLNGSVVTLDSSLNLVNVPGKTVALVGVHNLIVVETEDALLVCDRRNSQEVSMLVKELERRGLKDLL